MLFTALSYAQVGINTNTPDASSALEIESTTGGILIPRLTETQRDAIALPASGLMIYQTNETSGFYFYNGTLWTKIDGVAGPQGPAGSQGPAGTDGADGAQGPAGADGADGAQGPAGPTGNTGPAGPQGLAGADGEDGAQGPAGPAGNNGTDGNGIASTTDNNDGTFTLTFDDDTTFTTSDLTGPTGATGAQGPAGPSGADGTTYVIQHEAPTCESTQSYPLGTMVYDTSNSNGALYILTKGPNCSETSSKLFSEPQSYNGLENTHFYWFFNVSEPTYIYDLPEIQRDGGNAYTRLYRLQSYFETNFDPNLNSFSDTLLLSTLSVGYVLLQPGVTYLLRSGDVSTYNNPNRYSSTLPGYDTNLFLTLGQWEKSPYTTNFIQTTKWGLGVEGDREGFSYKSIGRIWQLISNF